MSSSDETMKKVVKGLTGVGLLQDATNMAATDLKDIIDDGTRTYGNAYDIYNKSKEDFEKIRKGLGDGSIKPVNVTNGITFKEIGESMAENGSKIVADTVKSIGEETKNIFKNAIAGIGKELSKVFFNSDFLVYDKTLTEYRVYMKKFMQLHKMPINLLNYRVFDRYVDEKRIHFQFYEEGDHLKEIIKTVNKLDSDWTKRITVWHEDIDSEFFFNNWIFYEDYRPPQELTGFSVARYFATNPASTRVPGRFILGGANKVFNNEDFMKGERGKGISEFGTEYNTISFSNDAKTDARDRKTFGLSMKDKTVRHILLSGVDFLPHFYDVALYSYNDNGFRQVQKNDGNIIDPRGFAVRLGKISVTPSRNDSFNLGIGERIIPKVRSSKVISKTGTFSFRLDKYLLWLENFNQAAGVGNIYNHEKIYSPSREFDNTMVTRSYVGNGSNAHSIKTCLLCSKVSLLGLRNPSVASQKAAIADGGFAVREYHQPREWGYMFEDVRFAGTQDAINYSADVSGPQDITVTFTYKRVRKVFYDTMEYGSLSSYGY